MQVKLVEGDSAGTVTALYVRYIYQLMSSHLLNYLLFFYIYK